MTILIRYRLVRSANQEKEREEVKKEKQTEGEREEEEKEEIEEEEDDDDDDDDDDKDIDQTLSIRRRGVFVLRLPADQSLIQKLSKPMAAIKASGAVVAAVGGR